MNEIVDIDPSDNIPESIIHFNSHDFLMNDFSLSNASSHYSQFKINKKMFLSSNPNNNFCNNCGRNGHLFHQCKNPIISVGFVVFRYNKNTNKREYLMIRRKNTLGFVDFIRGKYPIYDKIYLMNIVQEMTVDEKRNILNSTFDELWSEMWGEQVHNYCNEEKSARNKWMHLQNGVIMNDQFVNLKKIVDETNHIQKWTEPEWGFPKGRRNYLEKDYTCAVREFQEETGYCKSQIHTIHNVVPYEETFIGSNLRCYKHKYYIAYMDFENTVHTSNFQKSEVSLMKWMPLNECQKRIRSYNKEKISVLKNIDATLNQYVVII